MIIFIGIIWWIIVVEITVGLFMNYKSKLLETQFRASNVFIPMLAIILLLNKYIIANIEKVDVVRNSIAFNIFAIFIGLIYIFSVILGIVEEIRIRTNYEKRKRLKYLKEQIKYNYENRDKSKEHKFKFDKLIKELESEIKYLRYNIYEYDDNIVVDIKINDLYFSDIIYKYEQDIVFDAIKKVEYKLLESFFAQYGYSAEKVIEIFTELDIDKRLFINKILELNNIRHDVYSVIKRVVKE